MAGKASTPERRTLILWALLSQDGAAAFQKDLKPEPEKADRQTLEKDGLITAEKRGQRIWIEVTDKGWDWAGRNLASALPKNSPAGTQILHAWLTRLQGFMDARGVALADVLAPQAAAAPAAQQPSGTSTNGAPANFTVLRDRVRQAYLAVTKGRFNTRALLRDLRANLADVERGVLDDTLKRMQSEQAAVLYPLDNRVEITDADRAAAIHFAGEPRHILWIER